jgi:hypothetical protein
MAEKGRKEGTHSGTIRREERVVLSRNRSSLPLRVAKLVLFAHATRGAGDAPALPAHDARLDETVGGWRDVEAARQKEAWG